MSKHRPISFLRLLCLCLLIPGLSFAQMVQVQGPSLKSQRSFVDYVQQDKVYAPLEELVQEWGGGKEAVNKSYFYNSFVPLASFGQLTYKVDRNRALGYVVDKKTQRVLFEIPLTRDPKALMSFSPSNIQITLKNALVNAPWETYRAGSATWQSVKSTTLHFPQEVVFFHLVLGAIVAQEVLSGFAQSPLGFEDYISHSVSPEGLFGFYLFLQGSGISSTLMNLYITNPAFKPFIGYIGLGIGSFVQSVASKIMYDPNFKQCLKRILPKSDPKMSGRFGDFQSHAQSQTQAGTNSSKAYKPLLELAGGDLDKLTNPCDDFYKTFVEKEGWVELAPGLVSLLSASFAAGLTQKAITSNAAKRITGITISSWLRNAFRVGGIFPASPLHFWTGRVLQLVFFLKWSSWLEAPVMSAWNNVYLGKKLAHMNKQLVDEVIQAKKTSWRSEQAPGANSLAKSLTQYLELLNRWQLANMQEFMAAYGQWERIQKRLLDTHNLSYDAYSELVRLFREYQTEIRKNPNAKTLLAGNLNPGLGELFGVFPSQEKIKDLKTQQPDWKALKSRRSFLLVSAQIDTIVSVAEKLGVFLKSQEFRMLSRDIQRQLEEIHNLLLRKTAPFNLPDTASISRALDLLKSSQKRTWNARALQIFNELELALGNAQPRREFGAAAVGYLFRGLDRESVAKEYEHLLKSGTISFENLEDYYLYHMACGPHIEDGESTIHRLMKGFNFTHHAPNLLPQNTLVMLEGKTPLCKPTGLGTVKYEDLYSRSASLWSSKNRKVLKTYPNLVALLAENVNTRDFEPWWKAKVDLIIMNQFAESGYEYTKLLADFFKALNKRQDDLTNRGPLANGVIESTAQSIRLFSMILGELYKDKFKEQYPNLSLDRILTKSLELEPKANFYQNSVVPGSYSPPLLRLLSTTQILELDRLFSLSKERGSYNTALTLSAYPFPKLNLNRRLLHQNGLEIELYRLRQLFLQPQFLDDNRKIFRPITLPEANQITDAFEGRLKEFADLFSFDKVSQEQASIGGSIAPSEVSSDSAKSAVNAQGYYRVKLTSGEVELAILASNAIMGLVQGLHSYVQMSHATSWHLLSEDNRINAAKAAAAQAALNSSDAAE